jgi:hypothetical protein
VQASASIAGIVGTFDPIVAVTVDRALNIQRLGTSNRRERGTDDLRLWLRLRRCGLLLRLPGLTLAASKQQWSAHGGPDQRAAYSRRLRAHKSRQHFPRGNHDWALPSGEVMKA